MLFDMADCQPQNAVIKVIGVGGGGGNAVKHMMANHIEGVEFICANTDAKALYDVDQRSVLQIGSGITKGLGAGANPEIGRQAALEDRDRIAEVLKGSDIVFITAGMGGGTGTGGAPVVAEIAKELGILTVAVVTKPFSFEGKRKMANAEEGIRELTQYVDSLITIPNQKLEPVLGRKVTLLEAFKAANDVLYNAVQGIAELITKPGMMGVDFADVRTVMSEMGLSMMGSGSARGEGRALEAAKAAISSPLLEDIKLDGARGILINITANDSLELGEFNDIGDMIREFAAEDAIIVPGTAFDPEMGDELRVTVIATGLSFERNGVEAPQVKAPVAAAVRRPVEPPVLKPEETGLHRAGPDYSRLDIPPAVRKQRQLQAETPQEDKKITTESMDYLEIPSFLRRQAD